MQDKKKYLHLIIVFIIITIFGLPGFVDRIFSEHENTAYGQIVPWGLWVAAYIFFIGISAGAFLVSALTNVFGLKQYKPLERISLFSALTTLIVAMLFIVADLGHPFRAFNTILSPNYGSIMTWIIHLYVVYAFILLLELWLLLRPYRTTVNERGVERKVLRWGAKLTSAQEAKNRKLMKVLSFTGILVAVCFHGGVGALFAVVGVRAYWHTGLFPISFLISALLSGGALVYMLSLTFIKGGYQFRATMKSLGKLIGALLIIETIILTSEYLITVKGEIPSHLNVLKTIFFGPYAWTFWVFQVLLGTIIPLILIYRFKSLFSIAMASFLILISIFMFRLNIVIPQLVQPLFSGLVDIYNWNPRLAAFYKPSGMEWDFFVFGIGIMGLLLLFGARWLPLRQPLQPSDLKQ
jgi:protein NrfD